MTQVEALAKYAARASFADLSVESRRQLPVHILDSVGCCIKKRGAGTEWSNWKGHIAAKLLRRKELVPKKGLEPPHPCGYMDLNHARLPIPPLRQ